MDLDLVRVESKSTTIVLAAEIIKYSLFIKNFFWFILNKIEFISQFQDAIANAIDFFDACCSFPIEMFLGLIPLGPNFWSYFRSFLLGDVAQIYCKKNSCKIISSWCK